MKLLVADQTTLSDEAHLILKENFGAELVHDLATLSAQPFVLLTPPSPKLLEESSRSLVASTIIVTPSTDELTPSFESYFAAGVLDILLTPIPAPYLNAKMRVLLHKAKVRTIRELLKQIHRLSPKTLTQTELAFLKAILTRGVEGASREQLQIAAWGDSPNVANRSLDTHLFNLRRKLEEMGVDIQYRRHDKRWTLISSNANLRFPASKTI